MHTTDTTAAPFRVDAIYNPAIEGIYYDVQIDGNTARLRDQFGRIVEALEIVESIEYNHEGQPEPFKFIDPNGYSVCLFDLTYTTQQPPFICSVCGETKQVEKGSSSTGYGVNRDTGAKTCFQCIGREDELNLLSMKPGEKTVLYFTGKSPDFKVSNWPGSFTRSIHRLKTSRTNWGLIRTDFWFSIQGEQFHGKHIGHNNEIAHIRKLLPSKK